IGTVVGRRWAAREWGSLSSAVPGPLLTLALVIGLDLLARRGMPVVHPFPVLLFAVVFSAYRGGLTPGLVSAILITLYAVHFYADPAGTLRYTPVGAYSLLATGLSAAAMAALVGRARGAALRGRAVALERQEIETFDRRLTYLSEASAVLASSLDYEVTLRDLARLSVPSIADWSTVHLVSPGGVLHFVAGAHRDPARDLLVRALGESSQRVPFGMPNAAPRILQPVDQDLRLLATDADQLKIYRALSPVSVLQIPLRARDALIGVVTLVTSREYGRVFGPESLGLARELGQRASLAVENARLYREAVDADRRHRELFEANPQPMWVLDVDTLAFLMVNDAALRQYGYTREEFLGMTIIDLRPEDEAPGLARSPEVGVRRPEVALAQHQRKDGSIVEVEMVSHELELDGRRARLVLATDVTERARTRAALQRSEERLRQVQRIDMVGRLASGVAHDFNNLLTTIRGFSELLLRELPEADDHRREVEQIRRAAERGALLTGQLLAFGRHQALEPRVLDVSGVLRNLDGLIRRLVGSDIRVELREGQDVGAVRMDPGQLEQVIVNLVLNARDAMPSGGTLRIETGERQIAGAARGRHLRPGRYLLLVVSDTGTGLVAENAPEAYDAEAAAPSPGQRAGLGLSIVYGIVRRAGGAVRISSEPGSGTTVKVYLPWVEPELPGASAPGEALRGSETVLVAEDEDGVRELLRKILVEHGHTVLEARHGRDALMIAERYERPIHLLMTDVVMPEVGGGELARRLTQRRPGLRVLFLSGYTNDEVVRRGVPGAEESFVQKPFTPEGLMRRVREILDGPPAVRPLAGGLPAISAPAAGDS
ncbi:MAG TPA: response regulator, partial [Gemmatimonadales bacterium]|nr:response regulator [Gemmatimonadales bacterium]